MQVGDLVAVDVPLLKPVRMVQYSGIIVKIEEGDDFGDGPVDSMVSVLTYCGIVEVPSSFMISLNPGHAK